MVWLVGEWFLVKGGSRKFLLIHIFAWNAWTNGKLNSPMCMTHPHKVVIHCIEQPTHSFGFPRRNLPFVTKGAFVLGENDFRKSFSPFSACLVATENTIFRKLYSCWPEFTPLIRKWIYTLIFTSIHFRVTQNAQQHREKERRETQNAQEHRENESSDPFSCHWELRSSHRDLQAQNATAFGESERKNPLLRSTSRRWRQLQPDDHRPNQHPIQLSQSITGPATPITEPNTLSRWVFRHRFTVHTLTSPPTHTCLIHTLTSPVRSLHFIYIYIYIYILYIYLFTFYLFINLFNYQCFIKLCIYGLCISNVGAFLFAGY